jgi:hypothetical protein
MYSERAINYYESCSMEMIKNAVKVFIQWNVLQRFEDYSICLAEEYARDEAKLTSLSEHIDLFRNPYKTHTFDIRRAALEMPILSKL